jgi:hypothetical protein
MSETGKGACRIEAAAAGLLLPAAGIGCSRRSLSGDASASVDMGAAESQNVCHLSIPFNAVLIYGQAKALGKAIALAHSVAGRKTKKEHRREYAAESLR